MTTLADVERAVARRVGPFFQVVHDPSRTGTARTAYIPEMQSGLALGEPENLWCLRRGLKEDGTAIAVGEQDRRRLIQSYDSSSGSVIAERNWQQPCQPGEVLEFHHLNPRTELRPAVLAGLRRCFFLDQLAINSLDGEVDLTVQAPWITGPRQVQSVGYVYPLGGAPYTDLPFQTYTRGGHVMVTAGGFLLNGAIVTARRPADTMVNGVDGYPSSDSDELAVDLDYAAAAGHIEAWHTLTPRLAAAGAGNQQASQQMAAVEFTRQTMIWMPYSRGRFQLTQPFAVGA